MSDFWAGTRGNRNADLMIVGESWGTEEAVQGQPFVGASGALLHEVLTFAGYEPEECFFTNVVSAKPPNNDMWRFFSSFGEHPEVRGLYPTPIVLNGLEALREQIAAVQPKLIIGLGNYTLWALTEASFSIGKGPNRTPIPTGITAWRGSQLFTRPEMGFIPFLPTFHPAATFRTYPWLSLLRHDIKQRSRQSWNAPRRNFIIRPSFKQVMDALSPLIYFPKRLAVDLETRGNQIACIGLAWSKSDAICIPLISFTNPGHSYWSEEEERWILKRISELLMHPKTEIVGQNFIYDLWFLFWQLGIRPKVADDTMVKHHTIYPAGGDPERKIGPVGIPQKSLAHLASLYCKHYSYWKDDGREWTPGMGEEILWQYNCLDCVYTYEANEALTDVLESEGLTSQYAFQLRQLNELAVPLALEGFKVDTRRRAEVATDLTTAISDYGQKLTDMVPPDIWPREGTPWYASPAKLAQLFYDELGLQEVKNKTTGRPTTDAAALQVIAKREPLVRPLIDRLGVFRSLRVFYSTFTQSELMNGRMHSTFNVAGTATFRWTSSKNPFGSGANMQNVPAGKTERGIDFPNTRTFFIPDFPSQIIAEFDMSGADAQVVAWDAGAEGMKELLKKGSKLHSLAANEFEGTDEYPYYDMCKRRIHGTHYGASANKLFETMQGLYGPQYTSLKREIDFQQFWFSRFPEIRNWQKRVENSLHTNLGVSNQFGYRIRYFDRLDKLLPEALAWIPQSTIALQNATGALAVLERWPEAKLRLNVYDSIVLQLPRTLEEEVPKIAEFLSSLAIPYDDPLCIPWNYKIGRHSWE